MAAKETIREKLALNLNEPLANNLTVHTQQGNINVISGGDMVLAGTDAEPNNNSNVTLSKATKVRVEARNISRRYRLVRLVLPKVPHYCPKESFQFEL